MRIFNAFLIAFATYSRIPVPQAEWNEKNMKYSICFFPVVGAVVGAILFAWYFLCGLFGFNSIFFAAIAACIPTFVTGGIHMDGYCDTIDALSSYQPAERKLEILKDSNAGAFAVIKNTVYYLLYFACFTQISETGIFILTIGYVLSRALSGLAIVTFKLARGSGLAATFKEASHKKIVASVMIVFAVISALAMILIYPVGGSFAAVSALLMFIYYRFMSYKQFGGITGDIAGFFLVMCELCMAFGIIISEGVLGIWN